MRRRYLLIQLPCAFVAPVAGAQRPGRIPKLAILSPDIGPESDPSDRSRLAVFVHALRGLGYVDGQTIKLEYRFADGRLDRLAPMADELVKGQPDVIYTYTSGGADAAAQATQRIPIVVGPAGETILTKLAGSFARPTGNVTGVVLEGPGAYEKCLELLKEMSPSAVRVGVLVNPDNPAWSNYPQEFARPARALGLTLIRVEGRGRVDLDEMLARLSRATLDALLLANDSTIVGDSTVRLRIIEFTRQWRLPSATTTDWYSRDGGLLSLAADHDALRRRAAWYVHRILQGTPPGDLPIERPSTFQVSINIRTARAMGINIPPAVLARADEVIE